MRMLVASKTGTAVHQWTHKDRDILPNMSDPTQLDCIDESVNTWTYMTMMERGNLLPLPSGGEALQRRLAAHPRNTAVLKEKDGDYYAIDPSLVDAGVPPPVIPLTSWMTEWPPTFPRAIRAQQVNIGTAVRRWTDGKTAEAKPAEARPGQTAAVATGPGTALRSGRSRPGE